METADLYWDPKKKQASCCAWKMETAAALLLGRQPPLFSNERRFNDETPNLEANAELNRVNALLAELTDAYNRGRPVSIEEAAARTGVPLETAREPGSRAQTTTRRRS